MASTALQMVNRVLQNLSQVQVAAFADTDRSALAFEHVNQAARSLFEEGTWDYLVRHDGVLRLYAEQTSQDYSTLSNVAYNDGSTAATVLSDTLTESDVVKSRVAAYAVVGDDSKWGDTSFRILGAVDFVGVLIRLELEWHTTISNSPDSTSLRVLYPEYILPANVATVESARHQGDEVRVVMLDPEQSFDRRFPAPHNNSGPPEVIAIGGIGLPTISDVTVAEVGTVAETDYGIRAFIWPVPDDDYIVNFSYRIKPTALSATTDTFPGVPESAIDRIVDDATSEMMLTVPTSDVALGELNRRASLQKRERIESKHRPDKGRQFAMKSLDRVGRRRRRADETFGSLTLDG